MSEKAIIETPPPEAVVMEEHEISEQDLINQAAAIQRIDEKSQEQSSKISRREPVSRNLISPQVNTELARSQNEEDNFTEDNNMNSSFGVQDERMMSQGKRMHPQQLELLKMLQKPDTSVPISVPISEGDEQPLIQTRGQIYTQQTGGHFTTSDGGDATEYLMGTRGGDNPNGNQGTLANHVGVQSNGELNGASSPVSPLRPSVMANSLEKPKGIAISKKKSSLGESSSPTKMSATLQQQQQLVNVRNSTTTVVKPVREGKTVPAVDFMDMNKDNLKFMKSSLAIESKVESTTAMEEVKELNTAVMKLQPKAAKRSGAFRHTEYTKGFYKVGAQVGGSGSTALGATITTDNASSIGIDYNTVGYSEAERSNVLENVNRKPLAKIFGRVSKKKIDGSQTRNTLGIANLTTLSETTRFNSTQDTNWFKSQQQKLQPQTSKANGQGQIGFPQQRRTTHHLSKQSKDPAESNLEGGSQTVVDPMISFGRAIGPGGSLQPTTTQVHPGSSQGQEGQQPPSQQKQPKSQSKGITLKQNQRKGEERDQLLMQQRDTRTQNAMKLLRQEELNKMKQPHTFMPQITVNMEQQTSTPQAGTRYNLNPSAFKDNYTDFSQSLSSRQQRRQGMTDMKGFQRRNNSVITSTMSSFEEPIGNYGHPVHLACPKDFTLTPVSKLEPMGYDMNKLPRDMRITSDVKETDVPSVRQRLRLQRFDHLNYDPFIETKDGQSLYTGVLKTDAELQNEAEAEPTNIYAYLIKNGLVGRQARKRGDPIDMPTRRDFGGRRKAESMPRRQKAKPLSKIKELRSIFSRNDIPPVQTADINARITEYHARQNTKEYLGSWLHQRRGVDKLLDQGYHVCIDNCCDAANYPTTAGSTGNGKTPIGKLKAARQNGTDDELDDATLDQDEQNFNRTLTRVPSQKLSTLIHRKNAAMRREKRLREKEMLRSQMQDEDNISQDNAIMAELMKSGNNTHNQSERTIQAQKTTSQMILPYNGASQPNSPKNFNGKNYPAWMVNSQVVKAADKDIGTTRVITRKLNQVVKNPPSMASMGLKKTEKQAILSKKKQKNRSKALNLQYQSAITTQFQTQMQTTQMPPHTDEQQTLYQSNFNADMPDQVIRDIATPPDQRIPLPISQKVPTDFLPVREQKTENPMKRRQTIKVEEYAPQLLLDEPSQFEAVNNLQAVTTPQKILTEKQLELAEDIMNKTSSGGKANKILQRHWASPPVPFDGMNESIFSSEMVPQGITLPLKSGVMTKAKNVSSIDPTAIHVKDQAQEAAMDMLSNCSITQLDLGRNQKVNIDKKYNDCIENICNFKESIPYLRKKKLQKTQTNLGQNQASTSLFKPGSRPQNQDEHSSQADGATPELAAPHSKKELNADMSQLSQQLDVVVEKVDHQTSGSVLNSDGPANKYNIINAKKPIDEVIDARSDLMSEPGATALTAGAADGAEIQSAQGYDVISQARTNAFDHPSVLSKGSRIKRKIINQLRELMDSIKDEQDFMADTAQSTGGEGPQSVPNTSYPPPNAQLEAFLAERLSQVSVLRDETLSIEEFIADFGVFREFNANENIMKQLLSKKRQVAVNHELFETEEACDRFNEEKERQTLIQNEQRATLSLWQYDPKSKTRAISLENKMIRKDPLDMGVNSRKPGEQPKTKKDSRVPPYNANGHFDDVPKLCHTKISELRKAADNEVIKQQERQPEESSIFENKRLKAINAAVPKLTERPKKTSNNLKLDGIGVDEKKYLVITLQELLKLDQKK